MKKYFRFEELGTNYRREFIGGLTTFLSMAYILIVNPLTLSLSSVPDLPDAMRMDKGAVFVATALAAAVGSLFMGLIARYPIGLAPGMGLNAFFAYTVVLGMGYPWEFALTAVLLEGILFILLSFFNVREAIIDSIPMNLKHAVSVGIGLFIAFIGLANAGVVVSGGGTIIGLGEITAAAPMLAIIGIIITGFLLAKGVKGALLLGILITTVIGIPMGQTVLPENLKFISAPPSLSPIFFKFDFSNIFTLDMVIVLFSFLFVDIFDTVGTLVGVSSKADMLDKDGKVPNVKRALLADAIGTTAGACLGTSTVTTYVESAAGVSEGGRTGLTALTTAGMFAIALFLSPLFIMIPGAATAPALVIVGLFMMSPIKKIDLDDITEAIPAFLTIIMMPFAYSIAEGIVFGMVSYVVINILAGKLKKVSPVMIILAILFVGKFII